MAPQIPLDIRQPQFQSSSDLLQQGLGMANLATSTQLNQARLQEEKAKVQQAAEDREDTNAIQQEFMNPAHLKPDKSDPTHRTMDFDSLRTALSGKVRLRNLQKLDADHQQQVRAAQEIASTDKANQTNTLMLKAAQNKVIGQEIQGLEQLDDKDKPAFYVGALQRLQKQGIDISNLPQTIPADGSFNQQLQALAASHGYSGALLNDALKKQRAETAAAQAARAEQQASSAASVEKEKGQQSAREAIARIYIAANPRTPEDHLSVIDKIDKKYPELAGEYDAIKFDPAKTGKLIQDMALSAKDRTTAGQRDTAEEDRAQARQDSLDLRRQIASQTAAFHEGSLDLRRELAQGKSRGGLTQGQFNVEERNINALENGTANRPGLNAQRRKLGVMLKDGVDEKGTPFAEAKDKNGDIIPADKSREKLQSQLDAVNDNLQQTQFRKAKLYGIEYPATEDIAAAKDGDPIEASDGSVWKKSYGVAFFQGKGGSAPKPTAPPAKPQAQATPPKAPPANSGPVHIRLPNGKIGQFPNQEALESWARENHLTLTDK